MCYNVICVLYTQVLDVDFAGGRATIKLVPRLDLAAMAKDHMGGGARLEIAQDYHCACTG
jgi:hypothetical protein